MKCKTHKCFKQRNNEPRKGLSVETMLTAIQYHEWQIKRHRSMIRYHHNMQAKYGALLPKGV